jgi:vacuolar-type H+-ATPase subunit I/STV1
LGILFLSIVNVTGLSAQLKGAVPQQNAPAHVNEERKVPSSSPESIAKNNAEKLTKALKLNNQQANSILKAFTDYEKKVFQTNNSKLSSKEKYKKLTVLNAERQKALKSILTEAQYKAYILSFP